VSGTTPALLAAAAGVGFGHAVLPDHWVPLAVLGRTQRYSPGRVARLSGLAGVAHVIVSIVLGAIVIAVGLQLRHAVQSAQGIIVGTVLILTGIGFAIAELTGRGHGHGAGHEHGGGRDHASWLEDGAGHGHGAGHDHSHLRGRHEREPGGSAPPAPTAGRRGRTDGVRGPLGLASVMVPFGAAASPDLTILPVFLAASAAGLAAAIGALVVFALVTIGTITGLTLLACFGGYQLTGRWLDRWGNGFTALVLVAIGALVLTGVI
jgi:nickel/cobalt exporter